MKVIPEDEDVPCVPSKFFYSRLTFQSNKLYTNPGFRLPSLKNGSDLVYPEQNRDVKEILKNLIGCLEDWKLEKTDFSYGLVYFLVSFFIKHNIIISIFRLIINSLEHNKLKHF